MTDTTSTLDRFDEVVEGTTNDELIELTYRNFEELAERVGNLSRVALEECDRDLVNEAFTFAKVVDKLFPFYPKVERVSDASHHVDHCIKQLNIVIEARGDGSQPSGRPWMIRSTPASRRADEKRREEEQRKTDELIAKVDLSPEAVLEAFRAAVSDGRPVQIREVALALYPDAEPADTPGRQVLINRVSQIVRKLSLDGLVVKASEASYEKRVTCRWALPAGHEGEAHDAH